MSFLFQVHTVRLDNHRNRHSSFKCIQLDKTITETVIPLSNTYSQTRQSQRPSFLFQMHTVRQDNHSDRHSSFICIQSDKTITETIVCMITVKQGNHKDHCASFRCIQSVKAAVTVCKLYSGSLSVMNQIAVSNLEEQEKLISIFTEF